MKHAIKRGLNFGVTSGVITTLGLIVGLHSGTHSRLVVLGGILMIAIADAFSDALGIHISEESDGKCAISEVWQSTTYTFFFKFIVAMSFVIPILLLELPTSILVSVVWGLLLISILSFNIAMEREENPWKVIGEHLFIALVVILLTHFIGDWVSRVFG